ncbi:hypothetical protein E3N88_37609 [Mikania micrantha]|uniref:Uncharacterized protein n=1 Tax=Mikania micrantha TaxID=192012 RepID=A0A5N6LTX4_9ASTR|nr:hypothetical protein E3N88_37609 [Mikania micrantha]
MKYLSGATLQKNCSSLSRRSNVDVGLGLGKGLVTGFLLSGLHRCPDLRFLLLIFQVFAYDIGCALGLPGCWLFQLFLGSVMHLSSGYFEKSFQGSGVMRRDLIYLGEVS